MSQTRTGLIIFGVFCICAVFCSGSVLADEYIADHRVAKESVLRSIPASAIEAARNSLHIAYFHSSHGSRVISGMTGLKNFETGDDERYDFTTDGTPVSGKLDIDDNDAGGNDLSAKDSIEGNGHTQWYNETIEFLDDPLNADINVLMWSWCDPKGHDHQQYIDDMEALIDLYGPGGSKIGTGAGDTKTVPVIFVFMTGHPNGDGEVATGDTAYQGHRLITEHCLRNQRFCLDYWDIETHGMDDIYYPRANDNGVDISTGFEFYLDWQDAHPSDFFENTCAHCDDAQDLTCNRKAYAAWWLWARLTGYQSSGNSPITPVEPPPHDGSDPNTPPTSTPDDSSGGCYVDTVLP